ncbi:201_t:CDS:2, partial [Entrophospora sp. SA101]
MFSLDKSHEDLHLKFWNVDGWHHRDIRNVMGHQSALNEKTIMNSSSLK